MKVRITIRQIKKLYEDWKNYKESENEGVLLPIKKKENGLYEVVKWYREVV